MFGIKNVSRLARRIVVFHKTYSTASEIIQQRMRGIFAPIATTFKENSSSPSSCSKLELDLDALEHNLAIYNQYALGGLIVMGTNGENVSLDRQEREKVMRTVSDMCTNNAGQSQPRKLLVVGGVKQETAHASVEETQMLANAGAEAALVGTPTIYRSIIGEKELITFFEEVANNSPIPVIMYLNPGIFATDLSVPAIVKLSRHDNIVGIKDSAGDISKLTDLIEQVKCSANANGKFSVLAGSAGLIYSGVSAGCSGATVALANCVPGVLIRLYEATQQTLQNPADHALREDTLKLQGSLVAPNNMVTKQLGAAGMKAAMDLCGFKGGLARPPIRAVSQAERDAIRSVFQHANLI